AAQRELKRAGVKTACIEARDRIGGRILTVHDPLSPVPIELGAEFIHGWPPEIWNIVEAAALTAYDCTESALHIKNGKIQDRSDAWLPVDEIMEDMQKAADKGPDQSFAEFLRPTSHSADAKQLATSYVEGFNAARADLIGIASLAEDARAAGKIDGDRSFRILNGYDSIALHLSDGAVRLNSIVESIEWGSAAVTVHTRSALTSEKQTVESRRAIVTVPLGVLQAGSIRFDPEPTEILHAAHQLEFGHVVRVILRFRDRVWEQKPELADAGFLLTQEPVFPTWWTPLPIRAPIITGWSAGPKATPDATIGRAIEQLERITGLDVAVEAAYFHDWLKDPFARGAYSYVPAGAMGARETMAQPVADTLYFAGEATETNGHSATVHGAIASGIRAARQILEA
ncbi:MAG: FAD-dependent oxidoreductase, partial [Acidobacteriota bacterium]|nr:FAD-dependent oxidoreductase [Acidobacteriota bacterium]